METSIKNFNLKFLNEFFLPKEVQKIVIEKKESSKIIINYTKEDIRKKFFFRLITQDRFYNFLNFPISVLKKFFYLLMLFSFSFLLGKYSSKIHLTYS